MKHFFSKTLNFFQQKPSPHTPYKYNRIDFAPCKKSIMAYKLFSANLERFLRRIKSPVTR